MRRLLSATVGAVCSANCEGLPRIYDKTNPIFFISPSGAGAGSWRGGGGGAGTEPAWSRKLELDQKHLEIHCLNLKPEKFHPLKEQSIFLCVFNFSQSLLLVCLFVPSPCLPASAASAQTRPSP